MTAIDFTQLLRNAKKQAKKAQSQTHSQDNQPTTPSPPVPAIHTQPRLPLPPQPLPVWNIEQTSSLSFPPQFKIPKVCFDPPSIYYSPNCLVDSNPLWEWLVSLPAGDSGLGEWKTIKYGKRRVCMFHHPLPPPLSILAQSLVDHGIFTSNQPPNHVLLNDYQPSQGILPHTDGPHYASRTATFSLNSPVVLEFTPRLSPDQIGVIKSPTTATALPVLTPSNNESASSIVLSSSTRSILLHADSLIVFEDQAYLDYCHGIAMNVMEDITNEHCLNAPPGLAIVRGRRMSLTFRHALMTTETVAS